MEKGTKLRDEHGRFVRKSKPTKKAKEGFDYKGAYLQSQERILELESKLKNRYEMFRYFHDECIDARQKHRELLKEYQELSKAYSGIVEKKEDYRCRLDRAEYVLDVLVCNAMNECQSQLIWLMGKLGWFKSLVYRKTLREMKEEFNSYAKKIMGVEL